MAKIPRRPRRREQRAAQTQHSADMRRAMHHKRP